MTKAGKRILEGLKEAVAVASGEQPAARVHMNGHAYVPESDYREALARAEKAEAERDEARAAIAKAEGR